MPNSHKKIQWNPYFSNLFEKSEESYSEQRQGKPVVVRIIGGCEKSRA